MKTLKLFSFFTLVVFLSACSSFRGEKYVEAPYENEEYAFAGVEELAYESLTSSEVISSNIIVDDSGFEPGVEQKIIKTGNLTLHVEDVREAVEQIKILASAWGGDVSYSSVDLYGSAYSGYLTIQVDSEQFDAAMSGLKELAIYVTSEYTNAENITAQYVDTEARLNNLRAEEQQYLDILNKAVTVEEILNVTDYLSEVRYEIESTEAQLKAYDRDVDYSTITIILTEDESISTVTETWRPLSTIRDALSDWLSFLQGLVNLVIYLLIFGWPLVFIVVGIVAWRRRSHRK